tara:strand:+ start:22 stop:255 length:234 start_codon:yes stop_codon:yes gene_type:complete
MDDAFYLWALIKEMGFTTGSIFFTSEICSEAFNQKIFFLWKPSEHELSEQKTLQALEILEKKKLIKSFNDKAFYKVT